MKIRLENNRMILFVSDKKFNKIVRYHKNYGINYIWAEVPGTTKQTMFPVIPKENERKDNDNA